MHFNHILPNERFIDAVIHDSAVFVRAAERGVDANVPSCPGWTVRDVVNHMGMLQRQKAFVVGENRKDDEFVLDPPGNDLLRWFREGTDLLVKALQSTSPEEKRWSWFPSGQTAGFWCRRIAQETLIHRVDVELAHDAVTAVDEDMATDGVDEALVVFLMRKPAWVTITPIDSFVRLKPPGRSWLLEEADMSGKTRSGREVSGPAIVLQDSDDGASVACEISGAASAMDLWLWGRGELDELTVSGDHSHATRLQAAAAASM
jgi:uncharacterized protein (TIGR03083 family)